MIERCAERLLRRPDIAPIKKVMDTNFVLNSTKGKLISENFDYEFSGISTDSRTIVESQLFVALKGENYDGHKFICDAIDRGAAGVILEDVCLKSKPRGKLYVKVDSTLDSLGDLAKSFRESFENLRVIAITGSNGKTTTKEMVSAVIGQKYDVLKNTGNFNNLIGLPQTLFNLEDKNEVAVLELGMNRFGEIRRLAEICSPQIGVITNIGKAHIGNLGGIDGVKKAKSELVERFGAEQTFIVNKDDAMILDIAANTGCKKITYSLHGDADVRALNIERDGLSSRLFTLAIGSKKRSIRLNNIGLHNVSNALCASACGVAMGLALDEIASGLEKFEFPSMRLEIIDSAHGFKIINDCYNASPDSMKNAIDELSELKSEFKKIAVLGDMLELGKDAEKEHELLGEYIAKSNIDYLFTYGDLGKLIAKGAKRSVNASCYHDHKSIADQIMQVAKKGDVVLIKGSRGIKMEKVIKFIEPQE